MLTSDLLRYEIDDVQIRPRYLTRRQADHYLSVAKDLIQIFENQVGGLRHELDETLEAFEADRTDYKVLRGLIKLLDNREGPLRESAAWALGRIPGRKSARALFTLSCLRISRQRTRPPS